MKHLVRQGDTLSDLAERYGTSVIAIMKDNPQIKDKDKIYVGDTLEMPREAIEPTRTIWGKVKDLLK